MSFQHLINYLKSRELGWGIIAGGDRDRKGYVVNTGFEDSVVEMT